MGFRRNNPVGNFIEVETQIHVNKHDPEEGCNSLLCVGIKSTVPHDAVRLPKPTTINFETRPYELVWTFKIKVFSFLCSIAHLHDDLSFPLQEY